MQYQYSHPVHLYTCHQCFKSWKLMRQKKKRTIIHFTCSQVSRSLQLCTSNLQLSHMKCTVEYGSKSDQTFHQCRDCIKKFMLYVSQTVLYYKNVGQQSTSKMRLTEKTSSTCFSCLLCHYSDRTLHTYE